MNDGSVGRVLLVDPDRDRAQTVSRLFERVGVTVKTVEGVSQVLELAASGDVDCVVASDDQPDTDCLSLVRAVRDRDPRLPVVLVASDGSESLAAGAISAGVTDYVVWEAARRDDGQPLVTAVERATGSTVPEPDGTIPMDSGTTSDGSSTGGEVCERDATSVDADEWEAPTDTADGDGTSDSYPELTAEQKSTLLDTIFESIPVHLFVKDRESRHVMVSAATIRDPDAFVGRSDLEVDRSIASMTHARQAIADDRRILETGEPILDKEEYLPGRDRWNLTSKVPWRTEDGEIRGIIGVSRDVTERKRHREALERQNERLDEFASVVSHDLRGPLNVASGYLELARDGDEEAFDRVEDALDRMGELVADVLAVARQGQAVLEREDVSLTATATEAWETTDTAEATLAVADVTVEADRSRLVQLLSNLFANAVQHGSPRVHVEVGVLTRATTGGGEATDEGDDDGRSETTGRSATGYDPIPVGFYVADDGEGIDPADRETVFDPGYTSATDGTGFGLSIVDGVAEAHGWDVALTGGDEGGARFEFRRATVRGWSPGRGPVPIGDGSTAGDPS